MEHKLYDQKKEESFEDRYKRSPKIPLYEILDIIDWQLDRIKEDKNLRESLAGKSMEFSLNNTREWILREYEREKH